MSHSHSSSPHSYPSNPSPSFQTLTLLLIKLSALAVRVLESAHHITAPSVRYSSLASHFPYTVSLSFPYLHLRYIWPLAYSLPAPCCHRGRYTHGIYLQHLSSSTYAYDAHQCPCCGTYACTRIDRHGIHADMREESDVNRKEFWRLGEVMRDLER